VNFSLLGKIYGISGKKIFRWYQELSGFLQEKKTYEEAFKVKSGEPRKKLTTNLLKKRLKKVWKPANFGEKMAIDEKHIGGIFYTIISNLETKKIATILKTVKAKEIKACLYDLPQEIRYKVTTLTRDLAGVFENVGQEVFRNSQHIADKFHVLKLGFEALQSIRIKYRQASLTEERLRVESFKVAEAQRRNDAKKNHENFIPRKLPAPSLLRNGETKLQLLARSRYLLFKFESEWTPEQSERAKILFEIFPEIEKAYKIIKKFRIFYQINPTQNTEKAAIKLKEWLEFVGATDIPEIQNFASTVIRHKTYILNYFENGNTNALAESINNKIQRFLINNHGTRDSLFFFFRINNLLT
jgi:transposase